MMKTVLTALVLCCVQAPALWAQEGLVPDAVERAALHAIFDDLNGENWSEYARVRWSSTRIDSYPNPDSVPEGIGVVNGDIRSITLLGVGVSGTLPAELNDLTELRTLQLGGQLTNVLPNLGALKKLTDLNLRDCNIPAVSYPLWLWQLTALRDLELSGNTFTGPIPAGIGKLTSLRSLRLNGNNLSMAGAIPDSLTYLDNLQFLELVGCRLQPQSVNAGLSGLNNLLQLYLDMNPQFVEQGIFPDRLVNLPVLNYLSLSGNGFNSFPTSLTVLPALHTVVLNDTDYGDATRLSSTIDVLKACPALKMLLLRGCSIVSLPSDFDELSNITYLDLSANRNLDPTRCLELGYMSVLRTLYVDMCDLEDLPASLSESASLRELHADYNSFIVVPEVIRDIPHLEYLHLSFNEVGTLPNWFGDSPMTSLKKLWFSNNNLRTLNAHFSNLVNLTYLEMNSNVLDGNWPANFDQLIAIDSFQVNNNRITSLPDMSGWNHLSQVLVRNNRLRGTLPRYLTNATSQKRHVDIGQNNYNNIVAGSNYTGTSRVSIDLNRFTFEEVIPLQTSGSYVYAPQDTIVDVEREVFAYMGQTATLIAYADTALSPHILYQWFCRRADGSDRPIGSRTSAQQITYPITEADIGAKFYYRMTHDQRGLLMLTSRLQTLIIKCDVLPTALGFSAKKYACAMNFVPVSTYPNGCRTKAYNWDFGDNASSVEKSPFHAYSGAGTFDVIMKIRYSCGVCVRDTIVTKPITFNPNENFLMDSVLTVITDRKPQVLAASAATFADAWPLQYEARELSEEGLANGSDGIWRNEGTYVYKKERKASEVTDIAHDGTFDLDQFNWAMAEAGAVPDWIKANTMTEYSPYSYELENRDVLGVYTAALYDYGGHLPSANGVNMRHREMAFTSFEYFDSLSSGNWMFGNAELPRYTDYEVYSARSHVAIVKASQAQMENAAKVDVMSRGYLNLAWFGLSRSNYIANDPIVCTLPYPNNPDWSIIVLRREPFTGVWNGKIRVRNMHAPVVKPIFSDTIGHAGSHSLYVTGQKTFQQPRLELDSGKTYLLTAWVFTGKISPLTPRLDTALSIRVVLRDKEGNAIQTHNCTLTGNIIEGWQQVRGVFTSPRKWAKVELTFNSGTSPQAWFDDLRLHPEKGNMKTYVYDVKDYRLRAILDEENFGSFFFYDKEGNLYLTQKETEEGIKTISENVSYMTETH
jgi:Leucine-rich repeat (LRR) protein